MPQHSRRPTVLVAPLDWGLGHATRCIPIIHELLRQNCQVLLAAEGATATLLQAEFPDLRLLPLSGYRIRYAASGWGLALKIVVQIPKLLRTIKREASWLRNAVAKEKIDFVISDNRFGLNHPEVPCVIITHQLRIKAPLPLLESILQQINYRFINRFNQCWIPDAAGNINIAGDLSHPKKIPRITTSYLGPLSRFQKRESVEKGNLLILLSGPEPQRSLFEQEVLRQLFNYRELAVLVRGLPGEKDVPVTNQNVFVFNHLPVAELEQQILGASMVVARCGYSTVMDLLLLQKRSVLVPTPGQTEQEYLGQHLMKEKLALCIPQTKFQLRSALNLASSFPFRFFTSNSGDVLQMEVASFVRPFKPLP